MLWMKTQRTDPRGRILADRHYSRQTVGALGYTPPGRTLVLVTETADAVWATSWPYAEYVHRRHFPDAWVCTLFRNESPHLSSELIRQAIAATRAVFGPPPGSGMVTMVDATKVNSRNPGYCFLCAGFKRAGRTQERNLLVLHLAPDEMPDPQLPLAGQHRLSLEIPA